MNKLIPFLFLLLSLNGFAQQKGPYPNYNRNILQGHYNLKFLMENLVSAEDFKPYPKCGEPGWQELPDYIKESILQEAEVLEKEPWPMLLASDLLSTHYTGDRSDGVLFGRRTKLITLVLAECIENKGRYIEEIIDGVWAICEETWWGVPVHMLKVPKSVGLPREDYGYVDLFAAEAGMILSWTKYLMEDQFDSVAPEINRRIKVEVKRKIIDPCLESYDMWWMGYGKYQRVLNWTTWISSNWLVCTLICEDDSLLRGRAVHKILDNVDNLLNQYTGDGGCDEGPHYWDRAAGSLFDNLFLLKRATNNKLFLPDESLFSKLATYIYKSHIAEFYFVNYADGEFENHLDALLTYRMGDYLQDQTLKDFAYWFFDHDDHKETFQTGRDFSRVLADIFTLKKGMNARAVLPLGEYYYFDEMQAIYARAREGTTRGLYFSAKGGYNDESHNHNDIGNFVVYTDGFPGIIDAGRDTYIANTFNDMRYTIWNNRAAWHNTLCANGVMQEFGSNYHATNVTSTNTGSKATFYLEMDKAYPDSSGIKAYSRTFNFIKKNRLEVVDNLTLKNKGSATINLLTWAEPVAEEEDVIRIRTRAKSNGSARDLLIHFPSDKLKPQIEIIDLKGGKLMDSWKSDLYRIRLHSVDEFTEGLFMIKIQQD